MSRFRCFDLNAASMTLKANANSNANASGCHATRHCVNGTVIEFAKSAGSSFNDLGFHKPIWEPEWKKSCRIKKA